MLLLPIASVVVMMAGVVGIIVATPQTATFGWFAYAPLSGTAFSPDGAVVVGCGAIAGAAAVALGVAGLAFWAGFAVAVLRRHRAEA